MSFSVGGAVGVVRWTASWNLVLRYTPMLRFPSSDDWGEDCISVSSSEDDTTRVEAMLGCSLLDCSLLWVLPGSSLLECSSSENCGSASEAESELSRAGIRAGIWGCRVRGAMLAASVA